MWVKKGTKGAVVVVVGQKGMGYSGSVCSTKSNDADDSYFILLMPTGGFPGN